MEEILNKVPFQGLAKGDLFISMDANFGLVHKANSGQRCSTSDLKNLFFLNQDKVDIFVDEYFQDTKDNTEVNIFSKFIALQVKYQN